MPYEINFINKERIIYIKNMGDITYDELIEQSRNVIELAQKGQDWLILTDFTSVNVNVNISELFQFPKLYEEMGMDRKSRIAVLVSNLEIKAEELRFYETICLNRGWNIRIFLSQKEAETWLLEK